MDWLNLFVTQFQHWIASVPTIPAWFAAQFLEWVGTLGKAGPPSLGSAGGGDYPNTAATPELDSLVLFGTGLVAAGGYALTRFRARRQS